MKKIVIAWELGSGLGHILRLVPLVERFIQQDCEVVLVLRDLTHAHLFSQKPGCVVLPAPFLSSSAPRYAHETYADLLIESGFRDWESLYGLVRGWQSLYALLNPDLILMDYAPSALLAARICGVKTAWFGSGFFYPPPADSLPSFRHWLDNVKSDAAFQRERQVLAVVNKVLEMSQREHLSCLPDLFQVDHNFLCTWPELDCYERPDGTEYWGECFARERGAEEPWPDGRSEGIFCYVKAEQASAEPMLQALQTSCIPTLVYISNVPKVWVQRYSTKYLRFCEQPVNLSASLKTALLVVCPAGEGTIAATLLAGKPLLLLPFHAEQFGNAAKVEKIGAGINARRFHQPNLPRLLNQLLGDPSYRRAAQAFSSKYASFSTDMQLDRIAATCLTLARKAPVFQKKVALLA
ncbi:glycosyltransferase [Undibacterium sp. TJN25]|uniref:glycosyltransferase n=1 Tax=Undibacterium sp. TJN25 TaxID=3413056 RepID=UPI003BF28D4D